MDIAHHVAEDDEIALGRPGRAFRPLKAGQATRRIVPWLSRT